LSEIRLFRIIFLVICIASVVACNGSGKDDVPLIFVAASLSDVVGEAADLYEAETGNSVEFSFGGSIMLANQFAELGAFADGFFFVQLSSLECNNVVKPGSSSAKSPKSIILTTLTLYFLFTS